MTAPSYLAIDLGASSGRAVVGTLRDGVMETREVHRFRTPLVEEGGHLWWDAEALWGEVRAGVARALDLLAHEPDVAVEVADAGVDLRQREGERSEHGPEFCQAGCATRRGRAPATAASSAIAASSAPASASRSGSAS